MANAVSTFITIIIIAAVVVRFGKATAKRSGGNFGRFENRAGEQPQQPVQQRTVIRQPMKHLGRREEEDRPFVFERKGYGTAGAPGMKISGDSSFFRQEDRSNDWLARQMKEEQRILRRGDLKDLGAYHAASCDADKLKREHLLEHDDSIDDGEF